MAAMMPGNMMQPQIVLLREGTDTSQGKAQLISNINACQAVVDVVRTTLGPRGMDKLIHDDQVCAKGKRRGESRESNTLDARGLSRGHALGHSPRPQPCGTAELGSSNPPGRSESPL